MPKLRCVICGLNLDPEDDFEAGLWAAWHMRDFHGELDEGEFIVTFADPVEGQPAQWFLERGRQVVQ